MLNPPRAARPLHVLVKGAVGASDRLPDETLTQKSIRVEVPRCSVMAAHPS